MRWLVTVLCLLAGSVSAQTYPALHDVTGVAANDVLNIRQAPDAASEIVGTLAPDQKDVEVMTALPGGEWGLVNTGESSGWVAMRFLQRHDESDYALARQLTCFGTEPFWTLAITQGEGASLITPEHTRAVSGADLLQSGFGRTDRFYMGFADGQVMIIRRGLCSDEMTDRAYGLEVDFLTYDDEFGGTALLTGCCSIVPR